MRKREALQEMIKFEKGKVYKYLLNDNDKPLRVADIKPFLDVEGINYIYGVGCEAPFTAFMNSEGVEVIDVPRHELYRADKEV